MSLNGILSSALSALQTNSAGLNVVSNNVANINTTGYSRRVLNEQALTVGGQLEGVDVSDIQRVADQYLTQQVLTSNSASSQFSTESGILSQLNSLLGDPSDLTSLGSQVDAVSAALGNASLSPNTSANQDSVLQSYQALASTISGMSSTLSGLQTQADQQISNSIGSINNLIQQINSLNGQIENATAGGDDSSGLLDQRDQAVQSLSQYIGVRTATQSNGQMVVTTQDGTTLVGNSYAQLSYTPGTGGSYGQITAQSINPNTGQPIGSAQALDSSLGSGTLQGLINMRDGTLANLQQELGEFAQTTANCLQRAEQRQFRGARAQDAGWARHGAAFHRCAELHRRDDNRRHGFQRQPGFARRCRFRQRYHFGGWRHRRKLHAHRWRLYLRAERSARLQRHGEFLEWRAIDLGHGIRWYCREGRCLRSFQPGRRRLFAILRPQRYLPILCAFDHGDRSVRRRRRRFRRRNAVHAEEPRRFHRQAGERHAHGHRDDRSGRERA